MRFLECIVAAMQPSEGSFLAQMHQQLPKTRAWSELEFALQCGPIHGAGWVKQRVLRIPPAQQPLGLMGWFELKDQCRQIPIEIQMQLHPLPFRQRLRVIR